MNKNLNQATPEDIKVFLEGKDEEKYITSIELNQTGDWSVDETNKVYLTIDDPNKGKRIKSQKFTPFAWTKSLRGSGFYGDDVERIKKAAKKYGVFTEKLDTGGDERLEMGYKYIVKTSGTYRDLVSFFKNGGIDPWKRQDKLGRPIEKLVLLLPAIEQFMVQTGKRLFKGYEDYTEVHKLVFDIETTSLDPKDGHCFLIGIKDNRGYRKIIDSYENGVWNEDGERRMYKEFFKILKDLDPSVISGYNSENFDWHYILGRMDILGMIDITERIDKKTGQVRSKIIECDDIVTKHPLVPLKRKQSMLKLGAEVEDYEATEFWGVCVLDTYHRVRQAQALNSNIKSAGLKYIAETSGVERPNRVYVDGNLLGKIWVENKNYNYNPTTGQWYGEGEKKPPLKDLSKHGIEAKDEWKVVDGRFLITEYLTDDLLETEQVDDIYTQAGFLTSKLIPTTFIKSITMGTASIWKLLMCSWSYENGLAIPDNEPKRNFVGGLSRLLKLGFSRNIVKFDFASLYPSIQITHGVFPACDVTGAIAAMLLYLYDTRNIYKALMVECEQKGDSKEATKWDRKQLPIKIFNNSAFGSISAPHIFNWGDIDIGEAITCTGRQYLRQMIKFFMDRGYDPLVLDTDGVNFSYSEEIKNRKYVGRGLHRFVKEGVEYTGIDADVAEFNERFMFGVMGLDIDYMMDTTINLSRKNYANLDSKGKIKLTGNSIKSKTTQTYIANFLNKGVKLLLEGKGKEFVNYYYEYIERIYNKDIPLSEIANKSRVKKTVKQYLNRGLNKNGKPLPRQAHMELIIKENIDANLGDTIYYVNNGTRKSHGDIQVKKTKNDPPEGRLVFNSYLITEEDMKNNPDMKGDYNVDRYIDGFNKKVEPLLVVFSLNVRNSLLITNPSEKQYFTATELELVNGIPTNEGDQDTLEELMTMSDEEKQFWRLNKLNPLYMLKDRDKGEGSINYNSSDTMVTPILDKISKHSFTEDEGEEYF